VGSLYVWQLSEATNQYNIACPIIVYIW
jgi:hypothetical protein